MRIEHAAMYVNDIEAEKKFFQYVIDNSGADAYTGRVK